jgi:hypothetical protein
VAERGDARSRLALAAAVLILVAWAVSFTLDIAVETYDPHPSITPLALATVGWLFGGEVVSKLKGDEAQKPKSRSKEVEP